MGKKSNTKTLVIVLSVCLLVSVGVLVGGVVLVNSVDHGLKNNYDLNLPEKYTGSGSNRNSGNNSGGGGNENDNADDDTDNGGDFPDDSEVDENGYVTDSEDRFYFSFEPDTTKFTVDNDQIKKVWSVRIPAGLGYLNGSFAKPRHTAYESSFKYALGHIPYTKVDARYQYTDKNGIVTKNYLWGSENFKYSYFMNPLLFARPELFDKLSEKHDSEDLKLAKIWYGSVWSRLKTSRNNQINEAFNPQPSKYSQNYAKGYDVTNYRIRNMLFEHRDLRSGITKYEKRVGGTMFNQTYKRVDANHFGWEDFPGDYKNDNGEVIVTKGTTARVHPYIDAQINTDNPLIFIYDAKNDNQIMKFLRTNTYNAYYMQCTLIYGKRNIEETKEYYEFRDFNRGENYDDAYHRYLMKRNVIMQMKVENDGINKDVYNFTPNNDVNATYNARKQHEILNLMTNNAHLPSLPTSTESEWMHGVGQLHKVTSKSPRNPFNREFRIEVKNGDHWGVFKTKTQLIDDAKGVTQT